MVKENKFSDCDDNFCYTDGFPVNDNPDKKDEIYSRDPARPFDSGRNVEKKDSQKNYNPSGTTLNDPDKYKK